MREVILGYGKGDTQQYAAARKRESIDKMSAIVDAQLTTLMQSGLGRVCAADEFELIQHIGLLRLGMMELDLRIERRYVPAMIMIPDSLISIGRKLEAINATGDCGVEGYEQRQRVLEPYMAANVARVDMRRAEVQLAHCYRNRGAGPQRSVLTLGETILFALYYPSCFEGRLTAVIRPDMPEAKIATISVHQCSGKQSFVLREYSADDLPDAPFQLATCEVRVGR